MTEIAYVNGNFLPLVEARVPIEDRGLQFGDGVYEVAKLVAGRPFLLHRHFERLLGSLAAVRITPPLDGAGLERLVAELARRGQIADGIFYLQITRGAAKRKHGFPDPPATPSVIAYCRALVFPDAEARRRGAKAITVADRRWQHCEIKSTNLLANELARQEAIEAGAQEALLVGDGGEVREGTSANVFAGIAGELRTHPLDNRILPGVTRDVVLELARELSIPVREKAVKVAELETASEAFLTATTLDVFPLLQVNAATIGGGAPGAMTERLHEAFVRFQARALA